MVSRYVYMTAILDALRGFGRSVTVLEVYDWLIEEGIAFPRDLETVQSDGGTRFRKEVRWARKELFDAGLLSAPQSGLWELTPAGAATHLNDDDARLLVRANRLRR